MLLDIMTGVIRELDDMDIVDCSETLTDPAEATVRTAADLVILGCEEDKLPEVGGRLLQVNPDVKVLAVEAAGRRAFLYQLRPHKVTLVQISPRALVKAIRQAFDLPDEPESEPDSRPRWNPRIRMRS